MFSVSSIGRSKRL